MMGKERELRGGGRGRKGKKVRLTEGVKVTEGEMKVKFSSIFRDGICGKGGGRKHGGSVCCSQSPYLAH